MPILPQHLEPGDTVGLIAPASTGASAEVIERSVAALRDIGFKVKLGRHVHKRHGFLAGQDRERAGDLMRAFTDRAVKGIFLRPGRLWQSRPASSPLLDYQITPQTPSRCWSVSATSHRFIARLRKKSDLVILSRADDRFLFG